MSNDQGERIQANCRIIWGEGDYDLDIYADDYEYYSCWVKRDFGLSFGPPLTGTGLCSSPEKAWNEFDRMKPVPWPSPTSIARNGSRVIFWVAILLHKSLAGIDMIEGTPSKHYVSRSLIDLLEQASRIKPF